jgi:hypothetical protein
VCQQSIGECQRSNSAKFRINRPADANAPAGFLASGTHEKPKETLADETPCQV